MLGSVVSIDECVTADIGISPVQQSCNEIARENSWRRMSDAVYNRFEMNRVRVPGLIRRASGDSGQFATASVNDGAGGTAVLDSGTLMSRYAAQGLAYNGSDSAETLEGTAFDDTKFGGGGADTLKGSAGADKLEGAAGGEAQ